MWQIVINFEFSSGRDGNIHRLRNFGEELYRAFKDDKWASVDLDDVDQATNRLVVHVYSARRVRSTSSVISKLLDRESLAPYAQITHLNAKK